MRFLILLILLLQFHLGVCQDQIRAIKISKEVGRTIDSAECRKFNLQLCDEDFISAQILSVSGSTMMLRITKKDTVTDSYFSQQKLDKLKAQVGAKGYTSKEHLGEQEFKELMEDNLAINNIIAYSVLKKAKYERKIADKMTFGIMLKHYSRTDDHNHQYQGLEGSLNYRYYFEGKALFGSFIEARGITGTYDWRFYYMHDDKIGTINIVSFNQHINTAGFGINAGRQWSLGRSQHGSFELAFGINHVPLPASVDQKKVINGLEYNRMEASPCNGWFCRGIGWQGILLPGSLIFSSISLGVAF